MAYATGMLFIAQYSSAVIYFVPADLYVVNPNTTTLAIGEIRPILDVYAPMQLRDFAVLWGSQPQPGEWENVS